jgi:hypothetical protein
MKQRSCQRAFVVLVLVASVASAARSHDEARTVEFVLRTAEGKETRGPLRELAGDWSVRVGPKDAERVAGSDVVSLRRSDVLLPPMPVREHLVLANGDRLPLSGLRLDGEKLRGRCPDFGGAEVELPPGVVAAWWRAAPEGVSASEQFLRRLLAKERKHDTVHLLNGDMLEGILDTLDEKQVSLEIDKRSVATELARVAVLMLSSEVTPGLRPKGLNALLTLDSGARLTLSSADCSDGLSLRGKTAFGTALRVPLAHVVALDWLGGRAVYLSALKASGFDEPLPFLGTDSIHWPPVLDGSVDERDLRTGGSTYARGIGMHSPGRLRYNLAGRYRRFDATVGLDDQTGLRGSVRVRVVGDGKPLDTGFTGELTAKNGPVQVQANVTGVKELALEVDVGQGGNVQDHVDWADARVIR